MKTSEITRELLKSGHFLLVVVVDIHKKIISLIEPLLISDMVGFDASVLPAAALSAFSSFFLNLF